MRLITRPLRTAQTLATGAVHVARGGISLVEGTVRKHVPGLHADDGRPTQTTQAAPTAPTAPTARPAGTVRSAGADGTAAEVAEVPAEQEQIAEALIDEVEEQRRVLGDELIELDEDDQIAQAELMAKHRAQELEEERRRKEEAESNTSAS